MNRVKRLVQNGLSNFGYELSRITQNEPAVVKTHFEIDRSFHPLYERAQQKTQMVDSDHLLRKQRHYTLCYLLRTISELDGDVCELGCWRGLSSYQIANQLAHRNFQNDFCLFDSFEGLSEVGEIDKRQDTDIDYNQKRASFACSEDIVKENLKEFSFIKYFKGWVPARFGEVEDKMFSFVHIDLDLYQPIKDSFLFFYPRLKPGGVLVFDDYGCATFPGAKAAVDEVLEGLDNPFFLPLPSGQAFVLKH